ncbi:MAG: hypothetical protein WKF71_17515 [Pyrinomonadaceae bacterium]
MFPLDQSKLISPLTLEMLRILPFEPRFIVTSNPPGAMIWLK